MMKQTLKFLLLICIATLMTGCKLAVIVVEGGEVQSIGSGTCVTGSICIVDVTDPNFAEIFTAIPDEGWYFEKWNSGDRFFCGNALDPKCTLSFEGYEESESVEALVASSDIFYLMPVFKPIPSTVLADGAVVIDGKEWLQPSKFVGYSYSQISEVCPNGICSGSLPYSTFDLTGYTWASIMDVSSLFNAYGVNPAFTAPFQERYGDSNLNPYIALDFEITDSACYGDCPVGLLYITGMVREPTPGAEVYAPSITYIDENWPPLPTELLFDNTGLGDFTGSLDTTGIWFWRPSQNPD
jgi:hypothetical protein